jgi:hypothetical protein
MCWLRLCRLSPHWLLECCQQKLVLHMERLTRDKDTYTQVCLFTFVVAAAGCRALCELQHHYAFAHKQHACNHALWIRR